MLICQQRAQLDGSQEASTQDVDWLEAARRYPNLDEDLCCPLVPISIFNCHLEHVYVCKNRI